MRKRGETPRRKGRYGVFALLLAVAIAAGAGFFRYWYLPKRQSAGAASASSSDVARPTRNAGASNSVQRVVAAPVAPPDPWHGLMAGPVVLEKATDGHLIYAVGKLHNTSTRERFGIKVELDVFDAATNKVGTATDYASSIDAGKEWKFRALVTDRTAATAKLTSVKEN